MEKIFKAIMTRGGCRLQILLLKKSPLQIPFGIIINPPLKDYRFGGEK